MQVLGCASSLAENELWSIMSIVLQYRNKLGTVGGQLILVQSFGYLVLIRLLQLVQPPVGQRLLHRPTAVSDVPAGWAAGTRTGASSGATDAASAGHGVTLQCRISIGRFGPVWQGP